jgi:hypothetical protein
MAVEQHEGLIDAYLAGRESGDGPGLESLDKVYWERAERALREALKKETHRVILDKYQRFVVDYGVVDFRILDGPEARYQGTFVRELYQGGPANVMYFSEWLSDRFRKTRLIESMQAEAEVEAEEDAGKAAKVLAGLKAAYHRLGGAFDNLPGVPPEVVLRLREGQMDQLIVNLSSRNDPRADKLKAVREQVFQKARARVSDEAVMGMFDQIKKLEAVIMHPRRRASEVGGKKPDPVSEEVSYKQAIDFVKTELTLVSSVIKLGAMGSGIAKTHNVLGEDATRITKQDVVDLLPTIFDVDPDLPAAPVMMIAPFMGTGFFEWDRDTLIFPVQPTRDAESAIAAAFGHFRIMADMLHNEGRMRNRYEKKCGGGDFRSNFIRDYQHWVLRVGRGYRAGLEGENFEFFRDEIGPREEHLFALALYRRKTPAERQRWIEEIQGRIARKEDSAQDHYDLAILSMMEGKRMNTVKQLAIAAKMDPSSERTMFTLGHLLDEDGNVDTAKGAFEAVQNLDNGTIWQVYATDRLQNLK